MADLGYVIIEHNQAGGYPELAGTTIHDSKEDAIETADFHLRLNRASGRRERYTVAVVTELEDDDT